MPDPIAARHTGSGWVLFAGISIAHVGVLDVIYVIYVIYGVAAHRGDPRVVE